MLTGPAATVNEERGTIKFLLDRYPLLGVGFTLILSLAIALYFDQCDNLRSASSSWPQSWPASRSRPRNNGRSGTRFTQPPRLSAARWFTSRFALPATAMISAAGAAMSV